MSFTSCQRRSGAARRAFTLVEMLIAMALTLILVYAIAEFYAYVGTTVKDGRAMIDMVAQLRTASTRLKADLELVTVPMGLSRDDGSAAGYFEICEGGNATGRVCTDADANGNNLLDSRNPPLPGAEDTNPADSINDFTAKNITNMYGDTDDILAFTIRSDGAPFTGKACMPGSNPPTYFNISSTLAEVVWFTSFTDTNNDGILQPELGERQFLNRRLLLIAPGVAAGLPNNGALPDEFFKYNDISARFNSVANSWLLNSFIDLSRRENRFAHSSPAFAANNAALFPHVLLLQPFTPASLTAFTLQNENFGEDRLLANLLAFDVRVFDPFAVLRPDGDPIANAQGTLQPGDAGYLEVIQSASANNATFQSVGAGAYVDIGYGHLLHAQLVAQGVTPANATLILNNTLDPRSQLAYQALPPYSYPQLRHTYDNWAHSYERDGIDQDGDMLTDEGTNGFDDDSVNGVDDPAERETSPPYPTPLRGIQVKLRMYEPTTRQVRQATIGWDFISE